MGFTIDDDAAARRKPSGAVVNSNITSWLKTMFDLNEQITAWRQSFQGSEVLRTTDLNELEHHLRDSFEALTSKGLSPEEAFAIALRRVGDLRELTSEFSKVNGNHIWAQRAFWMIVGFLVLKCAGIAVSAIAGAGQLVAAFAGAGTITLNATSVAVTIACWLGIAVGLVQSTRDRREVRSPDSAECGGGS